MPGVQRARDEEEGNEGEAGREEKANSTKRELFIRKCVFYKKDFPLIAFYDSTITHETFLIG